MRQVISHKGYDTATATHVCAIGECSYSSDFRHDDMDLYVTAKGQFFIAGEGGPLSRWAKYDADSNSTTWGSGIRLLSREEAMDEAERRLDPDEYALHFGAVEQG